MDYQTIKVEVKNSVGYLTLNRPEQFNSLSLAMSVEMTIALQDLNHNPQVRIIVLRAVGKAFCTGMELRPEMFQQNSPKLDLGEILEKYFKPIIELIIKIPKLVICAVNGTAAGAGASLPLLCDITIAARSASFTQIFSQMGLIPDGGATWLLPRMIGLAKAKALMLTAEKISAEEAERIGMIYKVVDDDQLQNQVIEMAEHMATQATLSYSLIKTALNTSLQNDLMAQLDVERDLQRQAGQSEDFLEAVRAFLMKQKPNFKGR